MWSRYLTHDCFAYDWYDFDRLNEACSRVLSFGTRNIHHSRRGRDVSSRSVHGHSSYLFVAGALDECTN
ncbi:11134_t:CDS:2, partial [Cetraspora pellucida]